MEIIDAYLTPNPYSRSGEEQGDIENIVIHWVGNANTSAIANRNYFNNLSKTHATYASAHDIVGLRGELVHCIPYDEVAFHAGSYKVNRHSIGIETCHPDWGGKFNDETYSTLVEHVANLCKQYGLGTNDIIRHYDVTGKCCPKYYVEHENAWEQFKRDVANKIGGVTPEEPKEDEDMKRWHNGSTPETVFQFSNMTKPIGKLSPHETCQAVKINDTCFMVYYKVDGTDYEKCGFVSYNGGI